MANVNIRLGYKSAAWFTSNATRVLKEGQVVYLLQTGTYKIGDGATELQNLTFLPDLSSKMDKKIAENEQTDNYTLVLSDENKNINMNKGTAVNLTIPPNSSVAFGIGTQILFMQGGAGQVTVVPGSGVTVQCYNSRNKTTGQYAGGSLVKRGTNTWWLEGNLTT